MYCVNCGVKLSDSESSCPLCGTVAIHPDILREQGERLYPQGKHPKPHAKSKVLQIILSTAFLLPMLLTLVGDLQQNGAVTWSGFVVGALAVAYVILVLPLWFREPNPVIFVPCSFFAVSIYLLYISFVTRGHWFLSFALPVVGYVGLIITTVVVLLKYLRRGKLYIFGGACAALGVFMPLAEFLMNYTFRRPIAFVWSFYPLTVLLLLGMMLIFLAIFRPARETMERKFFL